MGKKRKKKKVLLSGSDPFYLSKKLRRRRYGEVSAQTSQKSQNRALVKKKVAYRAPAAQACTPPTWTINRIFSKSEILAESLFETAKKKKKNIRKHSFCIAPFLGCLVFFLIFQKEQRKPCYNECAYLCTSSCYLSFVVRNKNILMNVR